MNSEGWSQLELRHLMALQAIAREGSFAEAAASLDYTQSAVSQQVAALERAVGAQLVERPRGRRRIWLTEAGEALLKHADAIVAHLHAANADLAALASGTAGRLRVGTYQSVSARILPAVVGAFRSAWPDIVLSVHEAAEDDELFSLLERAELDLAVALLPPPPGPFETFELLEDPYVLLVAAGSALADRAAPLTVSEVGRLPLIGFNQCRQERWLEAQLCAHGSEPNWAFRSDDNGTIQGMVAADIGVALVPRLTIDPGDQRTVAIELGDLFPPRRLGVVRHADRSPAAAAGAFIELARAACAVYEVGEAIDVQTVMRDKAP